MKLDVDVITGLDKKKNPICVLKTDNPYVKSLGISSFKPDTPKKKYYGISLQGGYGIQFGNPIRTGLYVGGGFDYSFLRF